MFQANKSRGGFTLIELLVVIALLGILVAVAIVNVRPAIANQDLQTSAEQLISQIRTMQHISLQKSPTDAANRVRIDFTTTSYQITTDGSATPVVRLPAVALPSSVRLSGATTLSFDPFTLSNNSHVMITLTSTVTGGTRTLVIAQETGRIRLDSSGSLSYRAEE